ncbi:TetR/AcrR family transcriptional regulator [Nocardia niwae]|uniref:TetR/AcrR family transcriptional regulator C-terminal domain-containing protein n=1 Tax=Nocardia niwae TaxID=626084 RepID=A0ABV2XHM1_9NOCA|nr:TetR/AcrR family transcriptional regulator C-terminal domain-containing protein [Nocardia niwae]
MPAPRKFTLDQLQTAALELVDNDGLAGLTMRSLAGALGTGAMTIYNYVDGREGLEQLVTGAVMAQARWDSDPGGGWEEQVTAIAVGTWRAVRAHPNAIPLILTRRSLDEDTLRPAEALLRALARGGMSGRRLLIAFRAVSGVIAGSAQAELAGPLAAARGDDARTVTDRITGLPAPRFAKLIEIAHAALDSDPEDEFRAALHIILAGLRHDRE